MSLLCKHWQFLLGISAMAKHPPPKKKKQRNEKKKKKARKQNDKTQLFATTPPLECAILLFFCFLCFWFLVFWFVVGVFEGWQNNTKLKDLDLTLCQFSHFRGCKLAFGCFIVCFGPVVSLENYQNNGKMEVSLGEAWGASDTGWAILPVYVIFPNALSKNAKT